MPPWRTLQDVLRQRSQPVFFKSLDQPVQTKTACQYVQASKPFRRIAPAGFLLGARRVLIGSLLTCLAHHPMNSLVCTTEASWNSATLLGSRSISTVFCCNGCREFASDGQQEIFIVVDRVVNLQMTISASPLGNLLPSARRSTMSS